MKTQIYKIDALTQEQIGQIARGLEGGQLAVFATDTVYGIGTGAGCEESIQKICKIKKRPAGQPFQLLAADAAQAQKVAYFTPGVLRAAKRFWPGGLTLIVPPTPLGKPFLRGARGLGLRVPACRALQNMLAQMCMPLASTSANLHGQPVLVSEDTVVKIFDGAVDYILLGGTLSPVASSVLDATQTPCKLLREGSISKQDLQDVLEEKIC